MRRILWLQLVYVAACGAGGLFADEDPPPSFAIQRAQGPITIDGDLSDPGWKGATKVETWYETNPGDNIPPKVKNVGYLTYDDKFFYAAFEFEDPNPEKIRAPLGDRDNVPSYTDYGGVILDTRNDGKTGILLLANPRGIQYDAVTDDTTGNEDSSLDLFWDSAARITPNGWVLEMRVPFASLRYAKRDPQTWGILLYRNYPREYRYQMFSSRLPRGGNCFICRSNKLNDLRGLPSGGHIIVAPYAVATEAGHPVDPPGSGFVNESIRAHAGLDAKWTPNADNALDATVNPDFSQIESDTAQISANERFALFFPEKRPFFLEGLELFSTPIQAVYTRTITAPRWGLRETGKFGSNAYTVLVTEDKGGGNVIIPGSNASSSANQDFRSFAAIGRIRRDLGKSFLSVLATDREIEGGGHNRVIGPDFQWRLNTKDTWTGQLLLSNTETPNRPDLSPEWNGGSFSAHALDTWASHSTRTIDAYLELRDIGQRFRADDGFVPQVGYRDVNGTVGYTFRPTGLLSRLRTFFNVDHSADRAGALLNREIAFGAGMDGKRNSFAQFRYAFDRVRSGDGTLPRQQFLYTIQVSPSRAISQLQVYGFVGQDIDFVNNRVGSGAGVSFRANLQPTDHLELRLSSDRKWLNVTGDDGTKGRLFTAKVDRVRATYNFTAQAFVRLIGQYVETASNPDLYRTQVPPAKTGSFSASALFSYKLNWQTVFFLGYGDNRTLTDLDRLEPTDRQFFLKMSYAFQR